MVNPYSTATEMLEALRKRDVSSVELVEMHLARIGALDGSLNAIPVLTPELAMEAARRADAAIVRGETAPLLGLPMTLKESTQVAGLPQSAGIPELKEYRPASDGPIASSVFAAGACLLGKTNIPVGLSDWQADSPIYGRTNNPWDLSRTPGGSTGGGAAALAAGMTPLEIGSDIGGSIRVPAAFCGVYGHRPSMSAVPRAGSFPHGDVPNPGRVLSVQGPLARSVEDLELLFDVIAGPAQGEDAGWQLQMRAARWSSLEQFRVAVMPPMPWVHASGEMQARVDELAALLRKKGAKVAQAMPALDMEQYFRDYLCLLVVETSAGMSREEREADASRLSGDDLLKAAQAQGFTLDAAGHVRLLGRRELAREAWHMFFRDWDVLIGPTALDSAFPHQGGDQDARMLSVDGLEVPYLMEIVYPMWAIYAGAPIDSISGGVERRRPASRSASHRSVPRGPNYAELRASSPEGVAGLSVATWLLVSARASATFAFDKNLSIVFDKAIHCLCRARKRC
jgi:amidase